MDEKYVIMICTQIENRYCLSFSFFLSFFLARLLVHIIRSFCLSFSSFLPSFLGTLLPSLPTLANYICRTIALACRVALLPCYTDSAPLSHGYLVPCPLSLELVSWGRFVLCGCPRRGFPSLRGFCRLDACDPPVDPSWRALPCLRCPRMLPTPPMRLPVSPFSREALPIAL